VADVTITFAIDDATAIAQLAELQAALTRAGGAGTQAFGNVGQSAQQAFAKAGQSSQQAFTAATQHASGFQNFLSNVKSTMTGVFAADIARDFFRIAIEGAEKLKDALIDAGKQAASMEQIKMEMGIELGTAGVPASADIVNKWIDKLQYFSDTTTIQMKDAADAFRGALATGYTPDAAFKMIQRITDVAAATVPMGMSPSEHFKQIQETYLSAIKGGNLMERAIRPLEREGIQIRPFLEQKLGIEAGNLGKMGEEMSEEQQAVTEGGLKQLYKDIKKGEVPAHLLEEFFKEQTAPGGKYFGAAAEMGQTAIGGWSTLLDKFQTIMRGIGSVELGPFEGIINKINASFTPEVYQKVQTFFDGIAKKINEAFTPALTQELDHLIATLGQQDWSRLTGPLNSAIEGLVKLTKEMGPLLEWFAKDLPEEIEGLLRLTAAIEKIGAKIEHVFGWMLHPKLPEPSQTNVLTAHPINFGDLLANISGVKDIQKGWEGLMKQLFPPKASDDLSRIATATEGIHSTLTGAGTP
jgi:hypothetical protein